MPLHPVTEANPARTTVLYQTGFEPPAFAPGPLSGQRDWTQELGRHDGATIAAMEPVTGGQALRGDGTAMVKLPTHPFSGVLTLYQLNYNVIEHHTPVVELEADARLGGSNSGSGPLVNANLVAVGLMPYGQAFLAFNALALSRTTSYIAGVNMASTCAG